MEKEHEGKLLSFFLPYELRRMGFKRLGKSVLISRKSSIHHPERISIGNHVRIDDFCVLSANEEIVLGSYIHLNCYSALYAASRIIMEDFSGLSSYVCLYTESDDYSGESLTNPTVPQVYKPNLHRGSIILKRHTIVGTHSSILPNVIIETGTAIGAHSLVKGNCDPWSIYVGCPARKIGERKKDILRLETNLLSDV
jgi:galactoside O-acetyltransferase